LTIDRYQSHNFKSFLFFFGSNPRSIGSGGNSYRGENIGPNGAGSIRNDDIKFCNICAHNGFPHEAIIFVKPEVSQYVVPFEFVVGKKIVKTKWHIYDYFTGKIHEHRSRNKGVAD
jgi:hypothetical protein